MATLTDGVDEDQFTPFGPFQLPEKFKRYLVPATSELKVWVKVSDRTPLVSPRSKSLSLKTNDLLTVSNKDREN